MTHGLQQAPLAPAPPHAAQVVRRVLLRRNVVIDIETAQLVAAAVQAALQASPPSQPPAPPLAYPRCQRRAPVLTPAPEDTPAVVSMSPEQLSAWARRALT